MSQKVRIKGSLSKASPVQVNHGSETSRFTEGVPFTQAPESRGWRFDDGIAERDPSKKCRSVNGDDCWRDEQFVPGEHFRKVAKTFATPRRKMRTCMPAHKRTAAIAWLGERLKDGPVAKATLEAEGARLGWSMDTLYFARRKLRAEWYVDGKPTYWHLPGDVRRHVPVESECAQWLRRRLARSPVWSAALTAEAKDCGWGVDALRLAKGDIKATFERRSRGECWWKLPESGETQGD